MRWLGRVMPLVRRAAQSELVHNWRPEVFSLVAISFIMSGLWAFFELAELVLEGEAHSFDSMILLALRAAESGHDPIGPRWLEEVARDFTSFGSIAVLVFVLLAAVGYLHLRGKKRTILLMVSAVLGGGAISFLLKFAFDRPRPELLTPLAHTVTPSFPSGHALLAATTYLTLGALLARVQPDRGLKVYLMFLAILLAMIVGITRVYLGVHWPTDVLAGWTIGGVWALSCWLAARWLQRRGKMDREE